MPHRTPRILRVAFYIAFALTVLIGGAAQAQLLGTDTAPGESCAGYAAGATRMTADANQDGAQVVLICDGSLWQAAGGGIGDPAGADREIQFNSGGVMFASSGFVFSSAGMLQLGTKSSLAGWDIRKALISETDTSTNGLVGAAAFELIVDPAGNQTGSHGSFIAGVAVPGTSTVEKEALVGMAGLAENSGSGDITEVFIGVAGNVVNYGSANINAMGALIADVTSTDGFVGEMNGVGVGLRATGGSVDVMAGLAINDLTVDPAATVAERAGIFINSFSGTVVGGDFGIYQEGGNQRNYFAGAVGIGEESPVTYLQVYKSQGFWQNLHGFNIYWDPVDTRWEFLGDGTGKYGSLIRSDMDGLGLWLSTSGNAGNEGQAANMHGGLVIHSNGFVGINMPWAGVPGAQLHVNHPTTTGNSAVEVLRLTHRDEDSAGANNIGASLTFNLETATADTFREAAKIEGVFDDANNNSKDGSLRFYTMGPNAASGTTATTERMRIDSNGNVHVITGDVRVEGGAGNQAGCIRYDDSTDKLRFSHDCSTFSDLGGAGSAGASTQVIFNDGGAALGGDAGMTYDKTNDALTISGSVTLGTIGGLGAPRGSASGTGTEVQFNDGNGNLTSDPGFYWDTTSGGLIVEGFIATDELVFTVPAAVQNLTADNTLITIDSSYVQISSNNATATNRTFCLPEGLAAGQRVTIVLTTNGAELQDNAGPCAGADDIPNLASTFAMGAGDTISLIYDGATWLETSRSNN